MNTKEGGAKTIEFKLNINILFNRVREGSAALIGQAALWVDPDFGKQDITKLPAQELARTAELAQKVALHHYGQLASLATEFHLLGGPAAAKNNPSAVKLALEIDLQERRLASIKVGDQPVVEERQIFALKSSCKAAVERLQIASLDVVMNTFGIDATVQALLSGKNPEEIVGAAVDAQIRANLQEIVRQSGQK